MVCLKLNFCQHKTILQSWVTVSNLACVCYNKYKLSDYEINVWFKHAGFLSSISIFNLPGVGFILISWLTSGGGARSRFFPPHLGFLECNDMTAEDLDY